MNKLFFIVLYISFISIACTKIEITSVQSVETQPITNVVNENKSNGSVNSELGNFIVKPSNLVDDLRKKKTEKPDISLNDLANYGNELLKTKGLDYTFDWTPKDIETSINNIYNFEFTDLNNKKIKLQFVNVDFGHPCFSTIEIPITKVNEQSVTIFSNGKELQLKRPKDFYLEEFALVDKSLIKVIRKWKTPIDASPIGISENGKKVYFESWQFSQDESNGYKEDKLNLAVEVSENGDLRLVDSSIIKSGKSVKIDYDKQFTEIIYEKYKVGKHEYILKHSAPCT